MSTTSWVLLTLMLASYSIGITACVMHLLKQRDNNRRDLP